MIVLSVIINSPETSSPAPLYYYVHWMDVVSRVLVANEIPKKYNQCTHHGQLTNISCREEPDNVNM